MEKKRILVCAPTNERHNYVIDEWFESLNNQTYKDFDILLVYTGNDDSYARYLLKQEVKLLFDVWNPEETSIVQHLAHSRELYRQYAVEHDYDYIMHLDTDILLPADGLQKLIEADKDQVGYVVHVYPPEVYQPPCTFKTGKFLMNQPEGKRSGLDYYSWSWVRKYKGQLKKVYGTGLGVLLVKRKVFTEVPFRTHPTFINGEDMWYYAEADEKGFEAWCLVQRITHKNTHWNMVTQQENRSAQKIYFALGPEEATEAVMLHE